MYTPLENIYLWAVPTAIILFIVYYERWRRNMELNRLCQCMTDYIKCSSSNDTLEGIAAAAEYLGYEVKFYIEDGNIVGYEVSYFNDKRVLERWIKPL